MTETGRDRPAQLVVTLAALVVLVAGMRASEALLVPFLLSAFISIVCMPPLFWLRNHGVPGSLAVLLVVIGVFLVGLGIAAFIGTSVNDFSQQLPIYQARLREDTAALTERLRGAGITLPDLVLQDYLDPGAAMRIAATTLAGLGAILTNGFLILLTVVFILAEASGLPDKLRAALGSDTRSLQGFARFSGAVQRYLAIKTTVSAVTGLAIALWLAVIGVDYPLLWGLLAFLLNYVPNIGSIIAAVPAVLLALIQLGPLPALFAGLGYLAVNVVVGNFIEPRFMGRGLGLSTLVVFLSLVFWGWVLGPVGMLLSVPLTMIVKIALESSTDTRWIAILLDSAPLPVEPPKKNREQGTSG